MENSEQKINTIQDNSGETSFRDVELANSIEDAVLAINFGEGRTVVPIDSIETIDQLKKAKLGVDYRVVENSEPGITSVFDRIAFDPKNVRTQSFAIYEGDKPVGSMSFIIEPKSWIVENERYFQKRGEGVIVLDAHAVSGPELPEFYITPGWTKVSDSHRGSLALPGFRAFMSVMEVLEDSAPEGTWIEAVAQGQLPYDANNEAVNLSKSEVGTVIPFNELPFDMSLFGLSSEGSASTVKMAKSLGLNEIMDICSPSTLGPVFAKKIK
ncbi:MAG: hypothetical protein WCK26_02585 [Candidatus Saccharibacteria bacterium]